MRAGQQDKDQIRRWAPGLLRRVARRRSSYWVTALAMAALSASVVASVAADAQRRRDAYGTTSAVVVTTTDVAAGDPLAATTELRTLPAIAVPDGAVTELGTGTVAARRLSQGAVVTVHDVGDSAEIGPDEAAVALAVDPTTPDADAGDHVLVVVHADPFVALDGIIVAGRVLARDEERITVVVPIAELVRVSAAISSGGVSLARSDG